MQCCVYVIVRNREVWEMDIDEMKKIKNDVELVKTEILFAMKFLSGYNVSR